MQRGRELFPSLNMPTLAHPASSPQSATPNKEGIAIIGIGCRFPGGVNDAESFWKLLEEGREAVGDVPADRWNVERFYDAEPGIVGKTIAKRGGFIEGIDQFDPQFFGISPREAPSLILSSACCSKQRMKPLRMQA